MSIPQGFYNWRVEAFYKGPEGHPRIRIPGFPTVVLTSGEEWVVTTGGEGCDLEVAYQRACIAACEREIALARKTDDVAIWRQRLMEADVAERRGQKDRLLEIERLAASGTPNVPQPVVNVPTVVTPVESGISKFRKNVFGW